MAEYILELKQIVDYPRCRIYRDFVRNLMNNRDIRVGKSCGLYYYTVLCTFVNFRTSYERIRRASYIVKPGEWICTVAELTYWFRSKTQRAAMAIMDEMMEQGLLTYTKLGHGSIIRYRIKDWAKCNRVLEYNAPCQKDTGFFFMPMQVVNNLIRGNRCSEMDVLIDLWMNTVYNDAQVVGSEKAPVVYMRNGSGNPLISYAELGARWGISKASAGRYIQHLSALGCISVISFPGKVGSIISLCGYLSTMFDISDILLDKEEIALALSMKIVLPDSEGNDDESPCVSNLETTVIKNKIAFFLEAQGFSCPTCPRGVCKLYPLSDCKEEVRSIEIEKDYWVQVHCTESRKLFHFKIRVSPVVKHTLNEKNPPVNRSCPKVARKFP